MKRFVIFAIFFILFAVGFFAWSNYKFAESGFSSFQINGAKFFIEIADTAQKRALGLSGRDSLPQNQGMLFIFSQPDYYSFWMEEMRFALDFVWIRDRKVVQINQNVKPADYQPPESLRTNQPVDAVLEINAGMAQKLNMKIGDKVKY